MDAADVRFYRDRWNTGQKLRIKSLAITHSKELNSINEFATKADMKQDDYDDEKIQVLMRWAKLKEKYESGEWDGKPSK